MYIHPIIIGVVATILVEIAAVVIAAVIYHNKTKNKEDK